MSSVLISQRRESATTGQSGDGQWVDIQPKVPASESQSPIHDALNALAEGYDSRSLASAIVPKVEHLRPVSQSDIDAANYLDSIYGD